MNKMCGRPLSRSFQARTLSLRKTTRLRIVAVGPRCGRGLATPRAGTFARAGNIQEGSDGNALCDAW